MLRKDLDLPCCSAFLGYYHYSTLLYFHYLDQQLEQTSKTALFASRVQALCRSLQ